jgi:hypothetical protein
MNDLTIYQTVKDVIAFEWDEIAEEYSYNATLNLEATARLVWKHLSKNGELDRIRQMPQQWQREETAHLVTLDWFSSYEPITN